MSEQNNEQIVKPEEIAPPIHKVDESVAGTPLDAWRRGDPMASVMTAVRFVAEHPDVQTIAYCHDPIPQVFQLTDNRQKAAGKAWAAREFPHLNIRLRTMTLPYRGIGNDVTVVYAEVVKPKKATP